MHPFSRFSIPWAMSVVVAAIAASHVCQAQASGGATIELWKLYLFEDGSIDAQMGAADIGFIVFMPLADHCRTPVERSVSKSDVVTVFRGPNVRNAMPLGGPVPPVPDSVRVDTAISGSIHCEASSTAKDENKVTLRLKNIRLKDAYFEQIGPVEGIPTIPPP